jgi:hypothetical protein
MKPNFICHILTHEDESTIFIKMRTLRHNSNIQYKNVSSTFNFVHVNRKTTSMLPIEI